MKKVATCNYCGSTNILKDAHAVWDIDSQQWVLLNAYDYAQCNDCENAGNDIYTMHDFYKLKEVKNEN